jgi:ATP-dependent protease ClpP protease subunit
MKTRIEIRGIITSAMLDGEWYQKLIEKGMITPESRIRAAIDKAGPEIELYINSYGGDVLAGNEMIVALKAAMAAGKSVEITVGAMAFSMAANMLAMLPGVAKIQAYSNSRIGYHGAYTYTEGGAGAHKDSMEMLAHINAQVIAALKAKGVKANIESWFSEGRIKFLTAAQALQLGIIDSIIGENDTALAALEKETAEKLMSDGIDVAALGDEHVESICLEESQADMSDDIMTGVLASYNKFLAANKKPAMKLVVEDVEAEIPERLSKLQAAKDKEIASFKAEHETAIKAMTDKFTADAATLTSKLDASTKELSEAKASLSAVTAEVETTKSALAVTSKQLEEVKAAHAKLTGNALTPSTEYASWMAAFEKYGYEARKLFPDLYASFMAGAGANQKETK